ncbi:MULTISPECIES: hypothetical protein [unclassified Photobacterium]|uniref:hypothetical protein n=1 Tax=unclassified Photobacterium TaxID=2628852 RepID=UPI001B8D2D96|nr:MULTISPECIES: hypothetical protein [unclassified Photobacterium]MDO6704789.1 hypothetical protein [Photobacterium sp. 1_MG-2023]QUJ67990.1 hypothetical protein KDD30_02215 [Photobacterium sp. GJ3]
MRQSVYLRFAVLLIRLDLHREEEAWRREHRRMQVHLPQLSTHILQDMGIDKDMRLDQSLVSTRALRKTRLLRHAVRSRSLT